MARDRQSLALLTCKCASRHIGVYFFDISTSKSGPRWSVFNTFDFQICLVSQRRALFERLNFQKRSHAEVFLTCWLRHVLWTTATRTFSILHLKFQKLSEADVLYAFWLRNVLGSHSHMHFFNGSTFKSAPNLNCSAHFDSEMSFAPQPRAIFCFLIRSDGSASAALASLLFDPPENAVCNCSTFSRTWTFFLLTLSLLWSSYFFLSLVWLVSPLLFHLSILPEVWLLNFFDHPLTKVAPASHVWFPGRTIRIENDPSFVGQHTAAVSSWICFITFSASAGVALRSWTESELAFMHGPRRFQTLWRLTQNSGGQCWPTIYQWPLTKAI